MLLTDKTTVKFESKFPKILCASMAYKGTFVFVRMDKPGSEESIDYSSSEVGGACKKGNLVCHTSKTL